MLILVWFERSLHSAQVSRQNCPLPLKLMMLQAVERTWIRTGGYGGLRGECVNNSFEVNRVVLRILVAGEYLEKGSTSE